jgi:hypothetical protein
MTSLFVFLPIILAVIVGLILWFTVVPFVSFLTKQYQLSNGTAVPLPSIEKNHTIIPFPPTPANQTDLFKQLQKQQLAIDKKMAQFPCSGGGSLTLRPGVLCPEDNNMTKQFHTANNTV